MHKLVSSPLSSLHHVTVESLFLHPYNLQCRHSHRLVLGEKEEKAGYRRRSAGQMGLVYYSFFFFAVHAVSLS